MGFALTLIYIVVTIISPDQFGPPLTSYHPMVYLAGLTVVASLPSMVEHARRGFALQTQLLLGFLAAIVLSLVANGWFGGAIRSWQSILPSAAVFFFIVANVSTVRRLEITSWITVATCLAVTVEALCGYYAGFRGYTFVLVMNGRLLRLRAVGFLNDPNDFAQILLVAFSLLFVGWNRRGAIADFFVVVVPGALLLWAVYLTHSRGALIALVVLIVVAAQKRVGKTASVILACGVVFGMMALDFTGGRGISAADGADRLGAWSAGLQFFRSSPLFGIGFGQFTELDTLTAHNSFVLCLAELGILGSTIWVALLVSTMMSLERIRTLQEQALPKELSAEESIRVAPAALLGFAASPAVAFGTNVGEVPWAIADESTTPLCANLTMDEPQPEEGAVLYESAPQSQEAGPLVAPYSASDAEAEVASDPEYLTLKASATAMRLALVAFIVTSFFLSRSYATTMYLILGLAAATIQIARATFEWDDHQPWVSFSLGVQALAIAFIYGVVRLRH